MSDHDNNETIRAVRLMTEQLREQQPPELDWVRVEQGLREKIATEPARKQHRWFGPATVRVASIAVAAAAIALVLTTSGSGFRSPSMQTDEPGSITDVSKLETITGRRGRIVHLLHEMPSGSVVETDDEPLSFALPGLAYWTLAPHSRVIVSQVDMPQQLVLLRGAVRAAVKPNAGGDDILETFSVIAGKTRVAVHGTVFTVALDADQVTVTVRRGAVTVGPAEHQAMTSGYLQVAPSRVAYSLDGARGEPLVLAPPKKRPKGYAWRRPSPQEHGSAKASKTEPEPSSGGPAVPSTTAVASTGSVVPSGTVAPGEPAPSSTDQSPNSEPPPTTPSAKPSTAAPEPLSPAQARGMILGCLKAGTSANGGSTQVQVRGYSNVTVHLGAQGRVASLQFDPPLRPDLLERCGSVLFGQRISAASNAVKFSVAYNIK